MGAAITRGAGKLPEGDRPGAARKPSYGFDAPVLTRDCLGGGVAAVLGGTCLALAFGRTAALGSTVLLAGGLSFLLFGASLTAYALRGKFAVRDLMLGTIAWRGDERVLDIGTGRGLLLIGAAKRLDDGAAVGMDVWRPADLTGNSRENALGNAALEQVYTRVKIIDGDIRDTQVPDGTFDIVLSLACLGTVAKEDRPAACSEIARVLKPGGRVIVGDRLPARGMASAFAAAGLRVELSRRAWREAMAPVWIVAARKP